MCKEVYLLISGVNWLFLHVPPLNPGMQTQHVHVCLFQQNSRADTPDFPQAAADSVVEPSEASGEETGTSEFVDHSLLSAESPDAEETAPERSTIVCDDAECPCRLAPCTMNYLHSHSFSTDIYSGQRAGLRRVISEESSSSFETSYEMYSKSGRVSPLNNSIDPCISQHEDDSKVTREDSLYFDPTHVKKKSKCGGCDNCLQRKFYIEQKKFAFKIYTKRFLFYYANVEAHFNRLSDVVHLTDDVKVAEGLSNVMKRLDSYFNEVLDKFEVECFPATLSL